MAYEQRVDRLHPSALVFLIDQSASMKEYITGTPESKAVAVAEQINGLLFELVQRCTKSLGEPPRPYFAAAAIGYGTDPYGNPEVNPVFQGALAKLPWAWTSDLAQHPLRLEERERSTPTGTQRFTIPVWIDAIAKGGTPMCAALDYAGRLVRPWCDEYPNSFPPIVINLSDGEATDGNPVEWGRRLTSLSTSDGPVLFFNLGIGGSETPSLFSDRPPSGASEQTLLLWEMSSLLPPFMQDIARSQGFDVSENSRGFGSNADFRNVVTFLNVGTSVGHMLR